MNHPTLVKNNSMGNYTEKYTGEKTNYLLCFLTGINTLFTNGKISYSKPLPNYIP